MHKIQSEVHRFGYNAPYLHASILVYLFLGLLSGSCEASDSSLYGGEAWQMS